MDNRLTSFWEPGAPSPLERLLALADAEKRGFARSISIEPMLGGVEETLRVVEKVSLFLPQSIWAGKMNHIRLRVARRTPEVMDAIRKVDSQQSDSEILRLHDALKGIPSIRWKDSIRKVLSNHLGPAAG